MAGVIVVSGVTAAGKSTVCQMLASRFDRGVHVRGDVFRRMIVTGQAPVTPENADAAMDEVRLRYRLACQAADTFADAGFTVVLQDVVVGELMAEVIDQIKTRPRHVVVLGTRRQPGRARSAPDEAPFGDLFVHELDADLHAFSPRRGLWLDTSVLTPDEAVNAILDKLDDALIDVD